LELPQPAVEDNNDDSDSASNDTATSSGSGDATPAAPLAAGRRVGDGRGLAAGMAG
jgi:hypothetical protein